MLQKTFHVITTGYYYQPVPIGTFDGENYQMISYTFPPPENFPEGFSPFTFYPVLYITYRPGSFSEIINYQVINDSGNLVILQSIPSYFSLVPYYL